MQSLPGLGFKDGEKMKNRFDIFSFGENGPNWIKAVETLETTKTKLKSCLSTTAVAMRSLTTEAATAFLLPRSVETSGVGSKQGP
jgi:hypothetical protein